MRSAKRQCGQNPFAKDAVRGIDVSKHQGVVDFKKIKQASEVWLTERKFNVADTTRERQEIPGDIDFVAARVSDGLTSLDGEVFLRNAREIRKEGLKFGAYQFLRPNQSAEEQAKYFIRELDKVGGYQPGDLPPTVDIEVSDGTTPAQVQAAVKTWLKIVGDYYQVNPMVYSLSGISNYLGSDLTDVPLWIANFYQTCPKMPAAWTNTNPETKWTMFQFDDAGWVDGIPRGRFVDLNTFNGSEEEFEEFIERSNRRK